MCTIEKHDTKGRHHPTQSTRESRGRGGIEWAAMVATSIYYFRGEEYERASERARPLDETRRDTSVSGAKLSLQPQSGWAGRMEVICGASPSDRPTDFDWGLSFPSTCMRLRRQRLRSSAPFGDTIIRSNLTAITMMNYARSHCARCALSLYLPTSSLALPTIVIFC